MAADYYQTGAEGKPEASSEETEGGQTALLPRSLVKDANPGDTVTLRVTDVYEDEVAVELAETSQPSTLKGPPPMGTATNMSDAMNIIDQAGG